MSSWNIYAPGRAELLGNHTDYNEGYVLSIAVERGTTINAEVRPGESIHLFSQDLKEEQEVSLSSFTAAAVAPWSRYVLGVVDQFQKAGLPLGGFSAEISSNLPIGAGLSSSAALEIATALFLSKAFGGKAAPLEIAKLAQKAENEFVGVRCGLLDQISSLLSQKENVTTIDCRTFTVGHVPFPANARLILANSNVKHSLVAGEYNERRKACETAARTLGVPFLRDVNLTQLEAARNQLPDQVYRRALHIVGENDRVLKGMAALTANDLPSFGRLMFASHESSQHNFENSCPELDQLVDAARQTPGVYGARLSGGGFGGATINLVEAGQEDAVIAALQKTRPEATFLVTGAAEGALSLADKKQPSGY